MMRTFTSTTHPRGFTLIELMVVISIVAIAAGIVLPAVSAMQRSVGTSAGRTTVSLGVDIARAWATRSQPDLGTTNIVPGAEYSGTAAIFDQTGRIYIARNYQKAEAPSDIAGTNSPMYESAGFNGYRQIDGVDAIDLPSKTGVAGIRYNDELEYVNPPFAITFNRSGNRVDRVFRGSLLGTSDLDVQPIYFQWKPPSGDYATRSEPTVFDLGSDEAAEVPVVAGILVYDTERFTAPSGDTFTESDSPILPMIGPNAPGKALFFSPNSGVQIK
jgi:prepilin-type N-terminal cleavage/methylation domain-containing protein